MFFVIHFEGKIIVHFVFAVHVSNRIFHPNVDDRGFVCVNYGKAKYLR